MRSLPSNVLLIEEELELLISRSFPSPRRIGVETPPFEEWSELIEYLDNQIY